MLGVHFFAANDYGLGIPSPTRQKNAVITRKSLFRPLPLAAALFLGGSAVAVVAQIEGGDRGVVPTDNQSSFEVNGISVDVYANNAEAARFAGWREAQRQGWRLLWQKNHPGGGAPALGDGILDSMVSGIIIEDEQIGPNRYVARLGVLFDRVRASQVLGVSGSFARSAPMLVIPVVWSGGVAETFESRTEWQKAWARFRAGQSPIDYVRPSGSGADPLLLNAAQTGRRGRKWWRELLDQYGAADVLAPQVRLERAFPGGPVTGYFSARFGPDNKILQNFVLQASSSEGLPAMLDAGVKKMDEIYGDALSAGRLMPDPTLIIEQPVSQEEIKKSVEEAEKQTSQPVRSINDLPPEDAPVLTTDAPVSTTSQTVSTFTIQFDTPDVGSVGSIESSVRGVSGVRSASTTSLALGGVSVMRVTFSGESDALRSALAARGFRVSGGGDSFRISRPGSSAPARNERPERPSPAETPENSPN